MEEVINVEDIVEETYENMKFLKQLTVREYLVYKKFHELQEFVQNSNLELQKCIDIYKELVPTTKEEVLGVFDNIRRFKTITVEEVKDSYLFNLLLKGTSLMEIVPNPGRSLRFFVKEPFSNKVIGFLILGSDILSIGCRDEFIGWNKNCKIKQRKIHNTAIARIIVSTQPFGFVTNGGKLIALLLNSRIIRETWNERYKEPLVSITTTSLFGRPSMYDGVDRYIKNIGETKGEILISPDNNVMKKIHTVLRTFHLSEYEQVMTKTGPKQQALNLFFKKYKNVARELDEDFTISQFKHKFIRGVYLIPLYKLEEVKHFLNCTSNVEPKTSMFNSDTEILEYWLNKFANKRFEKIVNDFDENDIHFKSEYEKLLLSNGDLDKFFELNGIQRR